LKKISQQRYLAQVKIREIRIQALKRKKNRKMVTITMTVNGLRERAIPMVKRRKNLKKMLRLSLLKREQKMTCLSSRCKQSGRKRRKSWISSSSMARAALKRTRPKKTEIRSRSCISNLKRRPRRDTGSI